MLTLDPQLKTTHGGKSFIINGFTTIKDQWVLMQPKTPNLEYFTVTF